MKLKIMLILSLLGLAFSANSAILSAGSGVDFLVVNGQNVNKLGAKSNKKLDLKAGHYQLVARYEKLMESSSKNEMFTSKPYVFDVDVAEQDLTLSVPLLRNIHQARGFFRDPQWQLKNAGDNKTQIIRATKMQGEGFAAFSNLEKAVMAFNQQLKQSNQAASVLPYDPIEQDNKIYTKDAAKTLTTQSADALMQLKNWYNQASKEEKKIFKRWLVDQEY